MKEVTTVSIPSHRGKQLKPSPTRALTAKVKSMQAQGIRVISFGAGEPDFDTPAHIKQAAIQAIHEGFTKYTAVGGTDELKDAIIAKFQRENHLTYKRSQVLASCGGKHSFYNLTQAILEEGAQVIIPSPYWVSYPPMVTLTGATPVIVETREQDDFKIRIDDFRKAITPKTKAVILNSPSNPTGCAYTEEELQKIADIVIGSHLLIFSDVIYERFFS